MSEQKKLSVTEPVPAETRRAVEQETVLIEEAWRPPTMIPGVANPQAVTDGADFYRRLYRPHGKRWVTVGVWIFFIVIPAMMVILILFNLISRFIK